MELRLLEPEETKNESSELRLLQPEKPEKKELDILDELTQATIKTEGLLPGQTPLRDTNLSIGGRETSRFKDTVQGIPIDWEGWKNAPDDRKNFYFVDPGKEGNVIRRQWRNYFKNPAMIGLTGDSTLEEAVKKFDQQNPQNKLDILEKRGIDIKKKLKDFDISLLNPFSVKNASAQEPTTKVIPEIRAMRPEERKYTRELTDEDKAQALVAQVYREEGKEVPSGLKAQWAISSPEAKAITKAVLLPMWTALEAARGIVGAVEPSSSMKRMLVDSAKKGILEPDKVEPTSVAVMKAYPKMDWRLAAGIGTIAEIGIIAPGILELMGRMAVNPAMNLTKEAQFKQALIRARKSPQWNKAISAISKKKNMPIQEVDNQLIRKLWSMKDQTKYFNLVKFNLKRALNLQGEAGMAKIVRTKVGDLVQFAEGMGKVLSVQGEKAIVDIAGKQVPIALSQLQNLQESVAEAKKYKTAEEFTKNKGEVPKIKSGEVVETAGGVGKILNMKESAMKPQLAKSKVKPLVRRTTGQYQPEPFTIKESQALNEALRREQKVAKLSKRETKSILKLIDKIKRSPIQGMNYEERNMIDSLVSKLKSVHTKEELSGLYDRIKKVKEVGKQKYIASVEADNAKFELDNSLLLKSINAPKKASSIIGTQANKPSQVKEVVGAMRATTLRPARIFDALDGGQNFKGATHKYFMDRANDVEDLKLRGVDSRSRGLKQAMDRIGITVNDLSKSRVVEGNKFTIDEMLSIYLGAQNREKAAALVYGNKISYTLMRKVIQQMSAKEKALGEEIKNEYQGNYERVRKALLDYTNGKVDMGKSQNYSPIRRTMQGYTPTEEELAKEVLERSNLRRAFAERGFTKERVKIPQESQSPIKLGEFAIWNEQMEKQEHFIAHGKTVKEFQRMIGDRDFREAVTNKLGKGYYEAIQNWVNRIANPNIYKSYAQSEKVLATLRKNAAIAYLGFNVLTMAKQLPSFFLFLEDVAPDALLASIYTLSTNYKESMKLIHDLAPQMKFRSIEREMEEFKIKHPDLYRRIRNKVGTIAMAGIREMDKFVTHAGWLAVYNEGIKTLSKEEAAREATMAVLRTQPAAAAKDLADIYATGQEAINILIQFTNQLNQIYNILTYDIPMQARAGRYKDMFRTAAGVAISAALIAIISNKKLPKNKKEVSEMALDQGLSYVPVVGRGLSSMRKGYDFTSIPAFAGFESLGQSGLYLSKGEHGKSLGKAGEGAAVFLGLPGYAQGRRTLKGAMTLGKGGSLLYGSPKKKENKTSLKLLKRGKKGGNLRLLE